MHRVNNRTGIFHDFPDGRREIRIELADEAQMRIYRTWTPALRLQAAADMNQTVRGLVRAQLHSLYPDWTAEDVRREMARRYLGDAFPLWERALARRAREEAGG